MTLGSLFAGIGGFDLAARWAGIETVWQVEKYEWCQRVLAKNFPEATRYGDIRNVGAYNLERVDIISGGFPCQPFSVAGERKGTEDDRYLWPEMLRVIREIQPRWVIGENVAGIINMALDQVLTDLENEGYTCEAYIIPACAVNAPHRRDRVWIIAHSTSVNKWGGCATQPKWTPDRRERQGMERTTARHGKERPFAYPDNKRLEKLDIASESDKSRLDCWDTPPDWSQWPTQPGVCQRDDGVSCGMDRPCKQCDRARQIKAYGNAIVPQVALEFFRAILEAEK